MKATLQFNRPLRFNSPRNVRQIVSHTSCSSQSRKRLQQVEGGRILSRQILPSRTAAGDPQIPSRTRRLSYQGRPPRLLARSFGSNGSIFDH
jgi:hypothetical protein